MPDHEPLHANDDEGFEPDPVIEVYKRDVDRTLIREQLRRSVDVRVGNMIAALRVVEALREAARRQRPR
ncbi:MAG: hypothetical protein HYS06_10540 [Methylocystis sp.]|nr:hypothetical protein [Methylocystis sp.]